MKNLFIPVPVLLAALAALMGLATSCSSHFSSDNISLKSSTCRFDYSSAGKYIGGDAAIAQPVREINIDWYGGDIEFSVTDSDTLFVTERAADSLPEELRVHWYLEPDGELHLAFAKAGRYKTSELNKLDKHLLIQVPRGCCLDDVSVDAVNASLLVSNVLCRSFGFDCVNLDLAGSLAHAPEEISADAVNAKINLTLPETTVLHIDKDCVNADITSGLPTTRDDDQANCELDLDCVNCRVTINAK